MSRHQPLANSRVLAAAFIGGLIAFALVAVISFVGSFRMLNRLNAQLQNPEVLASLASAQHRALALRLAPEGARGSGVTTAVRMPAAATTDATDDTRTDGDKKRLEDYYRQSDELDELARARELAREEERGISSGEPAQRDDGSADLLDANMED